ncbi:MAG TPA: lysophospholipid acyltransferase family protein [Polyangiaceae bacterium]|nr:lysophospholipid acyltransferase family protein [Polyangiaceae bacterium]
MSTTETLSDGVASSGGSALPSGDLRVDQCRLGPIGLGFYNALYWPYLLSSCTVLFFPALLLWALTFWDPKRRWLAKYTSIWGAHYLAWAPFASVRVQGLEHAERERACVYVVNHQSMVDILAVFATHIPYKWVSKVENFYAPFLGWNMWLNGYVPLKRGYLPSILRMVRSSLKKLEAGHSLCVFPEGTRSPDGNLIDFYRGAFWVATRTRVPIVPIVIEGTGAILRKKSLQIRPQPTLVRVLPAIDPAEVGYDDRKLRALVRSRMAAELTTIRGVMR